MKEELNKDMENLRKKESNRSPGNKSHYSQVEKTVEDHSSILEKVEDRILELKDKIDIKGKTEELLSNSSGVVKGICKNSVIPSKDQT
jgi:hypothetical protein